MDGKREKGKKNQRGVCSKRGGVEGNMEKEKCSTKRGKKEGKGGKGEERRGEEERGREERPKEGCVTKRGGEEETRERGKRSKGVFL